jgi:hypothetical protein
MIYAIQEAKKRNPYNGFIVMWSVSCMLQIYQYYIECLARSPETAENNFKWCQRYYDEIYKEIEPTISNEIFV